MRVEYAGRLLIVCLASFSTAISCSNDGRGLLDIDVTVDTVLSYDQHHVYVYPRWKDDPCRYTGSSFTKAGECELHSDVVYWDCIDPPTSCLGSVQIISPQGPVVDSDGGIEIGYYYLKVPTIQPGIGYSLRIESCLGTVEMPLPDQDVQNPVITEYTKEEDLLAIHWTQEAEVVGAIGGIGGFSFIECHNYEAGATRVTSLGPLIGKFVTSLRSFSSLEEHETSLGNIRVWRGASTGNYVYVPQYLEEEEAWSLPKDSNETNTEFSITINNEQGSPENVRFENPKFKLNELDNLISFEVSATTVLEKYPVLSLVYAAGNPEDHFIVRSETTGKTYSGYHPHTAPIDPLDLGKPEPEIIEINIGPVTLIDEESITAPSEVSFTLKWDLGVPVARPVE